MTLDHWLTTNNIEPEEFAGRIGIHSSTLWRLRNGKTMPSRDTIVAIYTETKGEVAPNDFYGIANVDSVQQADGG